MNTRQGDSRRLERIGENAKLQPKSHPPEMLRGLQPRTSIVLKTIVLFVWLCFSLTAQAQTGTPTDTVNWTDVQQTIDGFGADTGFQEQNTNLTSAQADLFFTTSSGIGLQWIRIQDNGSGSSAPDLATLQLAVARGARVLLSMDFASGGASGNWAGMKTETINKINFLASNGVPVAAVSPQNEPNNSSPWTAAEFDGYISTVLGPAIVALNPAPIIVMPETGGWFDTDMLTTCMTDPNCSKYVGAIASHDYPGTNTTQSAVDGFSNGTCCGKYVAAPAAVGSEHIWETEVNGGFLFTSGTGCNGNLFLANYDPSIADALVWAHNIHDALTVANASLWMYWNLISGYGCNDGLTDQSVNPAKRFYTTGNWSKFVRPGWVRIRATAAPLSGVFVTAFKDPVSGNFAIIAVNQASSAQPLEFALNGFNAASVTPWVTSASLNLAQQPSISTAANAFSNTLPASSVTTFVGASSAALLPPTNLHATVH
jgi:glucuronoarabinoxylan endo-1,4-beta-xylanase